MDNLQWSTKIKNNFTTIIITISTYQLQFLSPSILLHQGKDMEEQRAPMEQILRNYYKLKSIHHKTITRVNINQSHCISSIETKHKTYTKGLCVALSTIPALMGCFLTIDYELISIHHEEEERKQNWMLRMDSNHVSPNRNLLYGRTYTDLSPEDLLGVLARLVLFRLDHSDLWCIVRKIKVINTFRKI